MPTSTSANRRSQRPLIIAVMLQAVFALAAATGFEFYLRSRETYVVATSGAALSPIVLGSDELIANTLRGRRLIPNAHVVIRHHRISGLDNIRMDINSSGFRGPEISRIKPPGELRVLVLGDSITWGDYLPEDQLFVRIIEQMLRAVVPNSRVDVINGGIGDVGTKEEVDILEERGLALRPDLVVIEWYLNDSRPPWGFAEELGSRGWLRRHSLLADKTFTYLRMQQWLRDDGQDRLKWGRTAQTHRWAEAPAGLLELVRDARYDWGAAWDESSWAIIERQFTRLKALAESHHFKVVVVAFPVSYQVYAPFLDDAPQRELQRRAHAAGFSYLDLLAILRSQSHVGWEARRFGDQELFFDQCHLRPLANRLVAAAITEFLLRDVVE